MPINADDLKFSVYISSLYLCVLCELCGEPGIFTTEITEYTELEFTSVYTPSVSKALKSTKLKAHAIELVSLGAFETEGVYTKLTSII